MIPFHDKPRSFTIPTADARVAQGGRGNHCDYLWGSVMAQGAPFGGTRDRFGQTEADPRRLTQLVERTELNKGLAHDTNLIFRNPASSRASQRNLPLKEEL